jgi:hypothetical protein
VAVFPRGELDSDRFGGAIRQALARAEARDDVVTTPDLADTAENALGRRLLTETRAYETRDGVFGGFPDGVQWQRVVLAREELVAVRYIDWDYWLELSGGSQSPVDAAPPDPLRRRTLRNLHRRLPRRGGASRRKIAPADRVHGR